MKTCTRCGAIKPPSDFHVRRKSFDGLNPACKDCICAARRARGKANRAAEAEAARRWREANPGYSAISAKLWREANPERTRANGQRWATENAARLAAAKRAWYEANKESVLARMAADTAGRRAANDRYRKGHRDILTERQRRRRVDKLGLKVEDVDVNALWTGECALCCEPMDRELTHPDPLSKSIDHIIPISRGGTHERQNLQWAHLICNVRKGNRIQREVA